MKNLQAGDFSGLAKDYSQNRPNYSINVLNSILGLISKSNSDIDFLDVGAGTGIWTRMVYKKKLKSVTAIEPNYDMRKTGMRDSSELSIKWGKGKAENTLLTSSSFDWVSMASSFHWADFQKATEEFHRILKPGGWFTAIWNPRFIDDNPMLVEIENHINQLNSNIKRISSGLSGITNTLTDKLNSSRYFENVTYIEGRHKIKMKKERYLGAWRSVNDLRVQLGEEKFKKFLDFVEKTLENISLIETTYLSRSWTVKRKD